MKFGPVAVEQALGSVLAHSLHLPDRTLRKGQVLSHVDISDITDAGLAEVIVATIEASDSDENTAAKQIAAHLLSKELDATAPFAGRVNLMSRHAGLLRVESEGIHTINRVDEAITIATLPDQTRVEAGRIVATIKIIPYAVETKAVEAVLKIGSTNALRLHANSRHTADLILTRTPGMKEGLLGKAQTVTERRLQALDMSLQSVSKVAHEEKTVAAAIAACQADIVLILGASATSDRADVVPAGLLRAGGKLHRFGMPVDPGNLLFTGEMNNRPVVGLPGCARSPALNGADWVLERLAAGQDVEADDIAGMGVGGLLKEIPMRKQPRAAKTIKGKKVDLVLLAAGASRRMRGEDKLLREVDGVPLIRRSAQVALAAKVNAVHVVVSKGAADRQKVLQGLNLSVIAAKDWQEGMAASLRAGMAAVSPDAAAVVVALADMPDVTPEHINRLIAAFDPAEEREICRAETEDGQAGHPVLFSRRFFENLMDLKGDRGAKELLLQVPEFIVSVPTSGQGAVTDLDTPEAWHNWRKRNSD